MSESLGQTPTSMHDHQLRLPLHAIQSHAILMQQITAFAQTVGRVNADGTLNCHITLTLADGTLTGDRIFTLVDPGPVQIVRSG